MKIVFFATRFAFEYSIELANNVLKHKIIDDVYLFLPEEFVSDIQIKQLSKNVEFISFSFPGNKKIYSSAISMLNVINKIKNISPDIVHVQGSAHPYFWLFQFKIKDIPIVDTIHDAVPHPGFGNLLQKFMLKKGVKKAKKWFIHGDSLKQIYVKIHKHIDPEDVIVIPKGHYKIFSNYSDQVLNEDDLNVLFFGNITKYKGIHILLNAANQVIKRFPTVKFVIAGKIRNKDDEIINLSHLKDNDNYVLKNYRISEKEVTQLYQQASLVVLPYIEASQSGVLSIAFGFGKAVIATKVGALPEIIMNEKTGLLIEPNNSIELAKAIIRLLDDKVKRKTLGKNAYEFAMNELSWEKVADETIKIYQELS